MVDLADWRIIRLGYSSWDHCHDGNVLSRLCETGEVLSAMDNFIVDTTCPCPHCSPCCCSKFSLVQFQLGSLDFRSVCHASAHLQALLHVGPLLLEGALDMQGVCSLPYHDAKETFRITHIARYICCLANVQVPLLHCYDSFN